MQLSPEQRLSQGEEVKLATRTPLELTPELSPIEVSTRVSKVIAGKHTENNKLSLGVLEFAAEGEKGWRWNSPVMGAGFTIDQASDGVVLGRSELLPDPAVSRRHFSVSIKGSTLVVEDLMSTNGTWVVRLPKTI